MRVVGGVAKGRRLKGTATAGARPTSELVRSAIFNILSNLDLESVQVLDLYAGSGSLGIEALSRGAQWADFVESNRHQCNVLLHNLRQTDFEDKSTVYCMSVEQALLSLKGPYGLVLMDPPYKLASLDPILALLGNSLMLREEAITVVGHSKRQLLQPQYGNLSLFENRRYGDSMVDFFKKGGS